MAATALEFNFEKDKEVIEGFLTSFVSDAGFSVLEGEPPKKYLQILEQVANREVDTVSVALDDLNTYDEDLCKRIGQNTKRYVDLFAQVIDKLMPPATRPISEQDTVVDVIIEQRQRFEALQAEEGSTDARFPPSILRRYTVFFEPASKEPTLAVRHIMAQHIGQLVRLRGIITRVTDVKPLLSVCTYSCDECGHEVFQEVKARTLTPLNECQSPMCKRNKSRGKLHMQIRACKFLRFQEARIQELADQVPMGHIPRSMTVHLYEGMTRTVSTGDIVTLSGIFLPTPYTGYKAIRAGLLADTYLEVSHVHQTKQTYDAMNQAATAAETARRVQDKLESQNVYEVLANSICPEIYGMTDVKKALLLLLVGGVTKKVGDGMKIRGDINVLLMGDPGVAKSQLLKWTSKVAPRGIYTTGKGSSGVGLTAAVMKDPVTGEMVLEGGALVLADNGICCIDEFDKMEDGDKTAIHEVMEQQTISISKAGIVTTLNARASILAAANPVYGRYNTALSPNQNINLPAALLSRFDIVFLLLDTPDLDNDTRLAQHVTMVHMTNQAPESDAHVLLAEDEMRSYIAQARQVRPVVPAAVGEYMTNVYVGVRKEEARDPSDYGYTTARTLVSILRMSQALARLRFSPIVSVGDVDEALRLMSVSKQSLSDKRSKQRKRGEHHVSRIFNLLKTMIAAEAAGAEVDAAADGEDATAVDLDNLQGEVSMAELKERVIAKGMTETQLDDMLREYTDLGVLFVSGDRSRVRFV
ncbi:DNA replication licensing factor MCM7 [Blastocladiella emersonii ATCC 22665]|nr:DNA replication licensing factor MCM7 [Blastocladiella emersonii ATCC 22665]